jgi:predicted protein tyrosine phosphatase
MKKTLSSEASALAAERRKALSSGLYFMFCAQETLDQRNVDLSKTRERTDGRLILGEIRGEEGAEAAGVGDEEGEGEEEEEEGEEEEEEKKKSFGGGLQPLSPLPSPSPTAPFYGPDLAAAQRRVDDLRMLLTNRDDAATAEAIACAVASTRAAMDTAGLRDGLARRLKREKPSKFELVNQVLPGLFVGGWAALNNDCAALRKRGVTHVLSVVSADQQRRLPKWVVGQRLVQCSDSETADLGCHFRDICAFIDEARGYNRLLAGSGGGGGGGACYVHCGAGISRAPTAVTAYLMHSARLRLREAFALVKRHRPSARPNKGFVRQLQAWEAQLFGSSTVDPPAAGLGNDGSMMPQRPQPPPPPQGGAQNRRQQPQRKPPCTF